MNRNTILVLCLFFFNSIVSSASVQYAGLNGAEMNGVDSETEELSDQSDIQFVLPGINLSLSSEELVIDEQRYFTAINSFSITKDNSGVKKMKTVGEGFIKFESSVRSTFSPEKFEYVISKSPKSIVLFKDSNTILVPSEEIIEADDNELESITSYEYLELNLDELKNVHATLESPLIPASSCLSLSPRNGTSGSVSLSFSNGVYIRKYGSGTASQSFVPAVAYSMALSRSVKIAESFSGTHSCSVSGGNSVRLFYKVFTFSGSPMYRKVTYDSVNGEISTGKLVKMQTRKYLAGIPPIYYCVTSANTDLMCGVPGIQFEDDNGDQITSHSL
ncbi:hypothetical protein CLIB1423_05S03334 [[Candida] railenensis]|uniref:Uncharacterized protein n=1 Tax=[Candida] railenensis TaxID=45579 RepID=A0A9P0VXG7_9ASCO|nr:hypothetical protein CLIB1423_05S03334 [[Candida] railenensis]